MDLDNLIMDLESADVDLSSDSTDGYRKLYLKTLDGQYAPIMGVSVDEDGDIIFELSA